MSESLHELSREALIEEARRLGLVRPEVFTRAELQDEIIKRRVSDPKQQRRARGLLGLARDLLASVVEKGLHLPEVAEKLRAAAPPPAPPPREPVATVTLAEIYVAQGHAARARKILDEVLAREPEHAAALALAAALGASPATPDASPVTPDEPATDDAVLAAPVAAAPPIPAAVEIPDPPVGASPPREEAPRPMLDDAPLPTSYGVEEIVALPIDPTSTLVYWETRRAPEGTVLELEITDVTGARQTRTMPIASRVGRHVARDLPAGATIVARLGARAEVSSSPLASTSAVTPRGAPSPRVARAFSRLEGDHVVALRAPMPPRVELLLALADVAPPSSTTSSPRRLGGASEAMPPGSSELAR